MRRRSRGLLGAVAIVLAALLLAGAASAQDARLGQRTITCLGRLEPKDGVIRVSGPSGPGAVVAELLVEAGDQVEGGQKLAVLDTYALRKAEEARLSAELENAEREFARVQRLFRNSATSDAKLDEARFSARIARADLDAARARRAMSVVHAPISGQVLEVHARPGERLGPDGVLELGRTDQMYAVAEVYETDIGLVRSGQRATIRSPAFPQSAGGVVERIGLKVGKMDVLGTDPVAKTDARVVEVRIRLDEDGQASRLTHLQVEVEIHP